MVSGARQVLVLATGFLGASGLFFAFVVLRDLPSRIGGDKDGRLAIQVLDEVRRPFLEIQGANSRLMNEGYNAASRHLSRAMSLLGDAEGPIHDDIDRGSEAVSELMVSVAVVIAGLLAATFWLMWSRNVALGRILAELRRTDDARRESEERFATLLREVDEVVWASTADGSGMLYMNQACERVYGRPTADFFERPDLWIEAVHPEDRDRVQREVEDLLEQGRIDQEYRVVRPDGEVRWLSDRKHVVFDDAGHPIRLGGIATDITERVLAREEREAFVEELESKNAELERFAYTVSHDLKAPLVTITGFLGLIEKDIDHGNFERARRDFLHIKAAADRMRQLLRELLELSRVGRLALAPEEVSLTELAREASEMVAGQLEASGVTVEIDPEMPVVLGDRVRLLEVYQNLLENAVKFIRDQATPRVEVGVRRREEEVHFYVKDNGRGIDPLHHERVFGLFVQLGPRTEGTGVGLALARRIVEVHGGRMWVESEGEGHGSTFCFTLPGSLREPLTSRGRGGECTA